MRRYSQKLGISRTPIREAIRLLANDGIVTMVLTGLLKF